MRNRDDEMDQLLKQRLKEFDVPPAGRAARHRAITLAREEFERVHGADQKVICEENPQENISWLRRIFGYRNDDRRANMFFTRKLIYSGGAAAIGALAVGISLQYPDQFDWGEGSRYHHRHITDEPVAQAAAPERGSLGSAPIAGESPGEATRHVHLSAESAGVSAVDKSDIPEDIRSMRKFFRTVAVPPDGWGVYGTERFWDTTQPRFEAFDQSQVMLVSEEPFSTFSADVDTASYSFVRRELTSGVLPNVDAVRAEEFINYFDYDYPVPATPDKPFLPSVVITDAPWAKGRKLLHLGIKGYELEPKEKPRTNLVFLLDVSGSMNRHDKLPLVKQSMELLLTTLNEDDTVAIVVYAGAAGTVLEPTPVAEKQKILEALRELSAGGSTAGAQGLRLAYEIAQSRYDEDAINRVILATDGDFNVGISSPRELLSFVERKREQGIFLSVLGFGRGNYRDTVMQTLAQNGNGVAAYIDTLAEAQKMLVEEAGSTLFPIASDVKFQVEFNPATVWEYRLIGYETRHLNREDFNNDAVDAGDIGAGHTVTAIYEFTPVESDSRLIEKNRYEQEDPVQSRNPGEYAFLRIRYKLPGEDDSLLITKPIKRKFDTSQVSADLVREARFATAVAGFAQLLKGGRYTGQLNYDDVIELGLGSRGNDPYGYRNEFIQLVRKAKTAAALQAQ